MAVNRFSPIQKLPEWQPQIPLDILVSGLTYKQELFDKNKALLDTNIAVGKGIADSIVNDEAAQYTRDKINNYKTYLNKDLAYADLTDDMVMKAADNKLVDVSDDQNIISWTAKSRAVKQEQYRMDELKKKGDERYDQLHENSFLLDYNGLKKASMKDGLNMATPSYTDFYDVDKEKQELIKNFKPNHIKMTKVVGSFLQDIEDQSVYEDQLKAYLDANLSDKGKRELFFRGEYEYKAGYQYETDPIKKQNFANNITRQYVGAIDAQVKAIDIQIEGLKHQQFKLDPKDKNYDTELANNKQLIQAYEANKANHLADKNTFLASPEKYTRELSQRLYTTSYTDKAVKGNVRIDKSETLRNNDNYWSGLNYKLSLDKFNWDKQKDVAKLELEYFKAGAQKDVNGNLVQADPFGSTNAEGVGRNLREGEPQPINVEKDGAFNVVREVENTAMTAKEQIYHDYFRKWEQEAAGSNGFFTAEQKANWSTMDAAKKKDYFINEVLPRYSKFVENNNSAEKINGQYYTRNADYVPQWFKDMRNDPRYRNSYIALDAATKIKEHISKQFKDQENKFVSPTGEKLNAFDLAEMSSLQHYIEEDVNINDAATLKNLLTNINNYIESNGENTGTGFIDWARSIAPGTNFSTEELSALSKKFGGKEHLKKVVENLLHNTNNGLDLVAFGGQGLMRAAEYAPGGAATGAALGLIGGPLAPVTSSVGALIGGAITGTAGFLYGLGEEILGRSTGTGFESMSDDAQEAFQSTLSKMVVQHPQYNVVNTTTDFYKKVQNPTALSLANEALGNRVNGFVMTDDKFNFVGIAGDGTMTFSYIKGDLSDGKSYGATIQSLSRIANSSGGVVTYDGEANSFKVKVDPKKIGMLNEQQELYHTQVLFANNLISSLPKREYYAKDPSQNITKAFTYQFSKNSAGVTELAFYRNGKKIVIPPISKAEAKAAGGIISTQDILDLDPSRADMLFSRKLSEVDMVNPGRNTTELDRLINYAENNQ